MMQEREWFWAGVVAGIVVMFAVALVLVNLLDFIPLVGPFIGGLVAGYIAGKGILNGGKAGIAAGAIGAVVIAMDYLLHTGFLKGITAPFQTFNVYLFVIVVGIYFAILGFLGGGIAGYLKG